MWIIPYYKLYKLNTLERSKILEINIKTFGVDWKFADEEIYFSINYSNYGLYSILTNNNQN